MASIDEVLNTMSDTDYLHDSIQFLIDEDLRTITIPSNGVVLGVVGDRYVNRVNFQMPRYYNGFDMSEFIATVVYINSSSLAGFYLVDDMTIENDTLYFTWLVDPLVTHSVGDVSFIVKLTKDMPDEKDKIFNTTVSKAKVLEGLSVDNYISEDEQIDFISQLSLLLNSMKDSLREIKEMQKDVNYKHSNVVTMFNKCINIRDLVLMDKEMTAEYSKRAKQYSIEAGESATTATSMAEESEESSNKSEECLNESKEILKQVKAHLEMLSEYPVNNYIVDENNQTVTYEQDGTSYSLEEQIIYLVLGKRPTT